MKFLKSTNKYSSFGEKELGEVLNLNFTFVIEPAVRDNLFDLSREELLALLLAKFGHLLSE